MNIDPENIIFEDESIVAINKPSGLLTIPDGYHPEFKNLKNELNNIYGRVWTVHRLDKETSGVIIFALTAAAHRSLNLQFSKHTINKEYLAITHNYPHWEIFEFEAFVTINGDRKHRTIISNTGKVSKSSFILKNINHAKNISAIKICPGTGYTHQIRCHLSHLGLPIVGDTLYSKHISEHQKSLNKYYGRMMLHANSIEFIHPLLNEILVLKAPTPILFDIN